MLRYLSVMMFICGSAALAGNEVGTDWTRFRGPDGTGVAKDQTIPGEMGPNKNVIWKIPVPEGISSPIVVGEKLFLTSHTKGNRVLHCISVSTGEEIWAQTVEKNHDEIATPPAGPSTPTPVSDGKSVYVHFADAGIYAWDLDGKSLWNHPTETSRTMHGLSSSLIHHNGRLYHTVDQLNESFILSLDAASGKVLWKTDRLSGLTGGYSTPVVYEAGDGKSLIITTGPVEVVAYSAETGARVWWLIGKSNAPVSSPMLHEGNLLFCEPVGEPIPMSMLESMDINKDKLMQPEEVQGNEAIARLIARIDDNWGNKDAIVDESEWNKAFDSFRGKGGLVSVNPNGAGDVSASHLNWSFGKAMPYIPCVLVDHGVVFVVDDGGVVTTVDASTGKQIRKGRLKKGNSQYYASPVAAGSHVVTIDTAGVLNVISNEAEWKVLSTAELGEPCFATPAIALNRLFVRTQSSLYCFGKAEE